MGKVINIPPQSGTAFLLNKGELLKVSCPLGEQVADMTAHNALDKMEFLSNGKTLDFEETLRLTQGSKLYSNQSNPMLEIVEDTCGLHDFLLAPCCKQTMKHFYNIDGECPTCADNLQNALEKYNIERALIPTAFNIFMNVQIAEDMTISVQKPIAKPGDFVVFKACMDLIIGLTACSAGASNGYSFKNIEYSIDKVTAGV
ncbi:urea carboxylase-associated family protein [Maribacter algicola]|uniref:Urea carboxylase-associated family protein n=1 Tax=Maribacter algicola TaxID=2498892 RepID=A0A3R8PYM6_9FLAO|nr:urea carboxylase-associated family protein [Maribacter algicola]RRQ48632.1 urea carboxylase-associated family protein [Maribacter algicola]